MDGALLRDCIVPKHYLVTCPVSMPSRDDITYVEHIVLLPSEIILWLWGTNKVTLPEITNLSQRTHVTLSNTLVQTCQRHCLPPAYTSALGFHGDGVPFQKSTHSHASLEVLSWNMLFEKKSKGLCFSTLPNNTTAIVGVMAGTH